MESNRMATWWIKWEDLNWPIPDNVEKVKRRAEEFAKADVSAAVIFGTHFRWDFMPFFPLLHDYIATVAEELHNKAPEQIIFDDRKAARNGEKFADADLLGIPYRVVISDKTLAEKSVEIKKRTESETKLLPLEDFIAKL